MIRITIRSNSIALANSLGFSYMLLSHIYFTTIHLIDNIRFFSGLIVISLMSNPSGIRVNSHSLIELLFSIWEASYLMSNYPYLSHIFQCLHVVTLKVRILFFS